MIDLHEHGELDRKIDEILAGREWNYSTLPEADAIRLLMLTDNVSEEDAKYTIAEMKRLVSDVVCLQGWELKTFLTSLNKR